MLPEIQDVEFDESDDRLKITLPVRRQWVWFSLFTILLLLWLAGLVWGILFTVRDIAFSGERYAFVFTVMLLIWLYLWYRLGKILWRLWQYYGAAREILYLDKERLIIRRPMSILGTTDAYDIEHVSPLFFSSKHESPGFYYGNQRVYFGRDLPVEPAQALVQALNIRYFNFVDEDY